nr:MAG TPA: Protein C [Inoviridae sp.]
MLCLSLCVPVFASNNASTRKWRVIASEQRTGENGSLTTYFKLSPYENGALYQVPLYTRFGAASKSISGSTVYDVWAQPVNYPDWWRSDIPLGARSYVEISNIQALSYRFNGSNSQTSFAILPVHRDTLMRFSFSAYSSASSFSGDLSVVPVLFYRYFGSAPNVVGVSDFGYNFEKTDVNDSSFSVIGALETRQNLVYTPVDLSFSGTTDFDVGLSFPFYNCSSSDLIWIVLPRNLNASSTSAMLGSFVSVRCTISYWVDANKLPAGLQVGDEFPADTDAFDKLRDDLINQFPEASENIENGKDTIQGWNDTETVDTDVANTSISVLNALFQNLGGFLFIISLMVFGAVVLRMLIRKAVDG